MLWLIHPRRLRVGRKGEPLEMAERLNPQPEPPATRHAAIPVELLKQYKEDLRIVRSPINGVIMAPESMLGELKQILKDKYAVLIVEKSEIR